MQLNSTGPALAQIAATPANPQGTAGASNDDYERMDIDNGINDDDEAIDEVRERFRFPFLPDINLKSIFFKIPSRSVESNSDDEEFPDSHEHQGAFALRP